MATQIARIGNRVAVEIPEELLRQANLAVGDPVEWTLTPAGSLALRGPNSPDESEVEEGYENGNWRKSRLVWMTLKRAGGVQERRSASGCKAWVRSASFRHPYESPLQCTRDPHHDVDLGLYCGRESGIGVASAA